MAASFTCDGCGCNLDKPRRVGHIIVRDYCDKCADNAKAFLAQEEEERKHYAKRFMEVRGLLIEVHGKDGFKLPDVA